MPAVMEKRKKNNLSGTDASAVKTRPESLGPAKKVFKTRPLTKKKAQKLKASAAGGKPAGGVAVVDRSAVQWRPRAEQAEWFTSSFHSVFGALLSPAEKEPLPGLAVCSILTRRENSYHQVIVVPFSKETNASTPVCDFQRADLRQANF